MALQEFLSELDNLAAQAVSAFDGAADQAALEEQRVEFLGAKNGRFKVVQKQMGQVGGSDRPAAGKRLNEVKQQIQDAFDSASERLKSAAVTHRGGPQYDPTLPGQALRVGRLHPITQTIEELKDIMGRLGFSVADGPEIEDERHNFEALNIPLSHPARDPLDNFYLAAAGAAVGDDLLLMRSQTSTVQIRVMENTEPPIRIISLGRVYRPDEPDATHYPMFHQMEGLLIDRKVTMADLKTVLRLFATSYLGADVHIRFRPSFFPFTEPSVEADFSWNGNWIEFGGAGMVDPNVLREVGYDPEEYTGFAFGLGVERLCMRRHNIDDIRELYKNDVRFLQQF
ncbi:phenylalanine--tRNA ligase subunit alpha [Lignipirellula cremea]|uniref:Phenylalanine--tRNA ligase alpha subunit n=1 Tax=Lignipirellula cremea TaxID=2528010 RepID=A0A518DQP6_9BACT|nr:phenylalanine--tRNA ligase subunit alpha [Lignipirellula cremea]QDU94165.1 Phenylalanine--tRNA ligase alpha subunit [Lignipirellula cremea]